MQIVYHMTNMIDLTIFWLYHNSCDIATLFPVHLKRSKFRGSILGKDAMTIAFPTFLLRMLILIV